MEYRLKIPKLTDQDFHCPCSKFVCEIGACACHNLKSARNYDLRSCDIHVDSRMKLVLPEIKGEQMYVYTYRGGSKPKSLDELKLDHPASYYASNGGDVVKSLKEQYAELKQNK
jgi:hypothetical protein